MYTIFKSIDYHFDILCLIQILEDIENDEVIIDDELADLIGNRDNDGEQYSITENGENESVDAELPVKINKAVEEGIGKILYYNLSHNTWCRSVIKPCNKNDITLKRALNISIIQYNRCVGEK